jgi:hypothetical protein
MKKIILIISIFLTAFLYSCESKIELLKIDKNHESAQKTINISSSELGAVKGIISSDNESERVGIIIYLGQIIEDSTGENIAILNQDIAPVANYDFKSGEFSFIDIKPGEYSLIIHEVVLGGQAYVDESGKMMIISVNPGLITDLGKIPFNGF